MPFWDLPATPQAAHVKRSQSTNFHDAISSILTAPSSPQSGSDSPSTSRSSSAEWTPESAFTTPPSSPSPSVRKRKISRPAKISDEHIQLDLLFGHGAQAEVAACPPAFFPCQRVAFSPKLRVVHRAGVKLDGKVCVSATRQEMADEDLLDTDGERLCGMMLAVTGVAEVLQPGKNGPTVKTSRLIADFCTDLSNGVKIWQKDSTIVLNRRDYACCKLGSPCDHKRRRREHARLPSGTYVLPLSMKIPSTDKLPPSFESEHFRLRYTLSLVLFKCSGSPSSDPAPQVLSLIHMPFSILPATNPTSAPCLPLLTHNPSSGSSSFFSSLSKLVSASDGESSDDRSEWRVQTDVPTTSFNPTEVVPITLTFRPPVTNVPCSGTQQIFIRLTLLRRIYVRDSSASFQQDNEWGFGLNLNDDLLWDRWQKDETELCQRWGVLTLPASSSAASCTRTVLRDIQLPLEGNQTGLGYSTTLDLTPGNGKPSLVHGESSWFSPTIQELIANTSSKSYDRHLHVSSRFYINVEIGFVNGSCPLLQPYASPIGGFVIRSSPSPFPSRRQTSGKPVFPGKLRELPVPITIGSVAEPALTYLRSQSQLASAERPSETNSSTPDWLGQARGPTSQGEDLCGYDECGMPIFDTWLLPPPLYEDAIKSIPAYNVD